SCKSTKEEPKEPAGPSSPVGGAEGQPGEAAGQAPVPVSEDAAKSQLKGQKDQFLAAQSIQEGDALLDRGDLEGALKAYSWAIELDSTNQAARDKLHKVQSLL